MVAASTASKFIKKTRKPTIPRKEKSKLDNQAVNNKKNSTNPFEKRLNEQKGKRQKPPKLPSQWDWSIQSFIRLNPWTQTWNPSPQMLQIKWTKETRSSSICISQIRRGKTPNGYSKSLIFKLWNVINLRDQRRRLHGWPSLHSRKQTRKTPGILISKRLWKWKIVVYLIV